MDIEKNANCECGASLPWHLFELELGMQHVCSCERKYEEKKGEVRLIGTERNPIAEWDAKHQYDEERGEWVPRDA